MIILGLAGNTGVAAYGVVANTSLVAVALFNGIAQGSQPLVSEAYEMCIRDRVLDMVHMMDDCIPYEVVREREFAPIKNLHGVDSLDSARELMKGCGIEL